MELWTNPTVLIHLVVTDIQMELRHAMIITHLTEMDVQAHARWSLTTIVLDMELELAH